MIEELSEEVEGGQWRGWGGRVVVAGYHRAEVGSGILGMAMYVCTFTDRYAVFE